MATNITVRAHIDESYDYGAFATLQGLTFEGKSTSENLITIAVSEDLDQTAKDNFDAAYAAEQAKSIYS